MYDKKAQTTYREKNRDRVREWGRVWREKNREHVIQQRQITAQRPEYKEREKLRVIQSRRTNPLKFSLQRARQRARLNGWEFDLDVEYLASIWTGICPIFGVPLTLGQKVGTVPEINQGSLDRLDNTKGYIKGNVQYISFRANNIKTDATFEELERIYVWWKSNLQHNKE